MATSSPKTSSTPPADGIPKRIRLVTQVADYLRLQFETGSFGPYLPGEYELAKRLLVGRNTIRKALEQLTREKVIEAGHPGRRRRILVKPRKKTRQKTEPTHIVNLLSPYPADLMPPMTLQLIDHLRSALYAGSYELNIRTSRSFQQEHPDASLEKLIESEPANAWILLQSSLPIQRWFSLAGIPTIILGMAHPDIMLPSISPDLRAVGRHAVGILTSRGHRQLALIRRQQELAGSGLLMQGVQEGCKVASGGKVDLKILETDAEVESNLRILAQLLRASSFPTGLLVEHSASIATIMTYLAQQGLLTPRDYSLISLFDSPVLTALYPPVTRYETNHRREARRLAQLVIRAAEQGAFEEAPILMMPEYQSGGSVAKAPS